MDTVFVGMLFAGVAIAAAWGISQKFKKDDVVVEKTVVVNKVNSVVITTNNPLPTPKPIKKFFMRVKTSPTDIIVIKDVDTNGSVIKIEIVSAEKKEIYIERQLSYE